MPEMPDVVTLTTISSNWGNQIRDRTVQRYSSVANRTTEHGSPAEGDLSYLEDSNTVWVYDGSSWLLLGPNLEVDGSVEVALVALTTSMADVASVSLTIPTTWGSWKCEAHATYRTSASSAGGYSSLIRIDGTDQQTQGGVGPGTSVDVRAGSIGGRRTGMTTTGSRAVALRMSESGTDVTVSDIYLYARAVRTS